MNPEQLTIIGMLIGIGGAGLAKQWVFGWIYRDHIQAKDVQIEELKEDLNFWRDATLQALGHTDKALEVAGKRKAPGA